jgi:hypothetical protein
MSDPTPLRCLVGFRPIWSQVVAAVLERIVPIVPVRTLGWRGGPVLVVSNEFFIVPGNESFANGGSSYTQNCFQVGVRLPIADSFSVRPYYLLQSVNLPQWLDTNEILGVSLAFKLARKTKTVRSRPPSCEIRDPERP